jgi:hypothetical protein
MEANEDARILHRQEVRGSSPWWGTCLLLTTAERKVLAAEAQRKAAVERPLRCCSALTYRSLSIPEWSKSVQKSKCCIETSSALIESRCAELV